MIKLAAISPRTGSLMVNSGDSSPEKQQFEQLFSEKAHATLGAKSPELANSIVHFKTLESSLDKNTAAGVFICLVSENEIHIPVMLAGGRVKSPEVFLDPNTGKFYPLTSKFLKMVSSPSSSDLGKTQKGVDLSDLGTPDIGSITSPPTTSGKFASYDLPALVARLPNSVKRNFKEMLKTGSHVLKASVKYHGRDFIDSLQETEEKTASPVVGYSVLTPYSEVEQFKSTYGDRYKLAYQEALSSGYVAADFRKNAAELVTHTETVIKATEPSETGFYKLLKNDGKYVKALVLKNPVSITQREPSRFLCVLENGDYVLADKLSAIETSEEASETSELGKRLRADPVYRTGTCTFIKVTDGKIQGSTHPEKLDMVSSGSSGSVTGMLPDSGVSVTFVKGPSAVKPYLPKGESSAFVPASYKPLYLRNNVSADGFMSNPDAARKAVADGLKKLSFNTVKVRKDSLGDYFVNGKNVGEAYGAIDKLASLGASVVSAKNLLTSLTVGATKEANLILRSDLLKLSSIFGGPAAPAPAPMGPGAQAPLPPGMAPPPMGPPPPMAPPGMPVDPATGMPMDPATGMPIDPASGMPVDPNTGIPVEQQMMMEEAARVNDQKVLDATVASVLLEQAGLRELTSEYTPKLADALDSLGRILITVQMNDYKLTEQIGPEEYNRLENSLKKVFHGLGDILLRLVEAKNVPEEGADLYGFSS